MPCDIDLVLLRAVGQGSAFADFRSYAQRSQRIVLAPDWSQMRKTWRKSRWLVAVHRKRTMWRMMESQEADGTSSRLRRWGALVSLGSDLVIASSSTPVLIRQTPLHYPRRLKKQHVALQIECVHYFSGHRSKSPPPEQILRPATSCTGNTACRAPHEKVSPHLHGDVLACRGGL